jgi:2-polyprenyl-3-methyl-5-hydroxy-6-metoxy-1,4-benzoquinol methylase
MKQDNMPQVSRFWNAIAAEFDAIYTGENKSAFSRLLDRVFRQDIYQRFDWVMQTCGDVHGKTLADIGCGSGRFVTELARRGAAHVTGVDVAPEMLKLAQALVEKDGVSEKCDFVLNDVLNWRTEQKFDTTIAIGFWDYIQDPPERLRLIRNLTKDTFLSAWPRFWTWRMPVRKVRLQYIRGCPVYFFREPEVYRMLEGAGFQVVNCQTIGKLFCVEARVK